LIQVFAVCALLIAFNGLYVAAEFAAVSVRSNRIQQAADDGSMLAGRLVPFMTDPRALDAYIAACQVGITISSLVLGAYGQQNLAYLLVPLFEGFGGMQTVAAQSTSAIAVLMVLTVSQMVLGELVPKSLALQFPTPVSLATVLPMEISLKILSPFIKVLNGSGWILLRALGISQDGHRHLHSPEEIQYLVAESRKGGLLAPEEQKRLQQALSMGVRRVRQLMVPRTEMMALRVDATVSEAHEITRTLPYTRYPVYRGNIDGIVGYVHARDLAHARLQGRGAEALEGLSRPILGVPEELSADRLLARLRETRSVMALVVDEYGGVAGIVTIHDLLTELLGDVADEPWPDEPAPERLPDGVVRLPGRMSVHDAEEWTDLRWDGHADTVNGIVTDILGRLPVAGDTVIVDGGTVMVEAVDGVVAAWVVVTPPSAGMDDA
jgi:putative hemolysin